MSGEVADRRVRPLRPFTVVAEPDRVVLIGGEDFRFALAGPGIGAWVPGLLAELDGTRRAGEAVAGLPEAFREAGLGVLDDLWSERVLVEVPAREVGLPHVGEILVEGTGPLVGRLSAAPGVRSVPGAGPGDLRILCQDRLDFLALDRFATETRDRGQPSLWVTTGPGSRAFVSPVCLPGVGPCPACLAGHFRRRSPAPELYDLLRRHAREGGHIVAGAFPEAGLAIVEGVVRLKLAGYAEPDPPEACFLLHSLDPARIEVTTHPVPADPDCGVCARG